MHPARLTPQGDIRDLPTLPSDSESQHLNVPAFYPFLLPPANPDEIGRLGNYRILRLLGKGGMGFVFLAEDLDLRRPVALKVLKPELSRDAEGGERFLREARAMASIKHDSLVTVFQVGRERDAVYLAMELLEGVSLEGWLARVGRPDLPSILRVGKGIAKGLATIHGRGFIHRDIKPANLWMEEPSGRVKILDFGLARCVHDDASITQSGVILGTPCFMSPEQARGEPLDLRSDLFSFGSVLYTLCTGTIPFDAPSTTGVLTALAVHDPRPVHQVNPAVPRALSDLVTQLLQKRPQDRPASAEAVLERLLQIEEGLPALTPTKKQARARPAADTGPTVPLHAAKETAAGPGWGKVGGSLVLATVVAFAVPWIVSWFKHGVGGAPLGEKGRNGVVSLNSLEIVDKEHWPFTPPPKPGLQRPRLPGEVSVKGRRSPNGIFMHPPPHWEGSANVTYRLPGEFEQFRAEVSLNDGPLESESPFTFAVYGDGRLLWKSRPVSRQADQQSCTVSVRGVGRLKIEVQSSGDPRGAHAVWVEPSLTK